MKIPSLKRAGKLVARQRRTKKEQAELDAFLDSRVTFTVERTADGKKCPMAPKAYTAYMCEKREQNERAESLGKAIQGLKPDAAKQRKRVQNLRTIAPKGGRACPSHYTDAEVTNAFTTFKAKNPGKSAWDAANILIRKGCALEKYGRVTGPYNRAIRIAREALGLSIKEWFAAL